MPCYTIPYFLTLTILFDFILCLRLASSVCVCVCVCVCVYLRLASSVCKDRSTPTLACYLNDLDIKLEWQLCLCPRSFLSPVRWRPCMVSIFALVSQTPVCVSWFA